MALGMSENALWEIVAKWMRNHQTLNGARMILGMMNQWSETVLLFSGVLGCEPDDALAYSGEKGYPLVEAEIEMADSITIRDCRLRLQKLEKIAQVRPLTEEEEEERRFITSYLKEVSFRGKPRKFSDSGKRDHRRKIEALRYTLTRLGEDHPDLAEYAWKHIQTSPFRWV